MQDDERGQGGGAHAARTGSRGSALSDDRGVVGVVRARVGAVDAAALVRQAGEVLEGVVEDGRGVLTGHRLSRGKRWPWAAGAAVAGAVAGAGVAYAVRRLVGQDAPGALEPEQLRAVVDTGLPEPTAH